MDGNHNYYKLQCFNYKAFSLKKKLRYYSNELSHPKKKKKLENTADLSMRGLKFVYSFVICYDLFVCLILYFNVKLLQTYTNRPVELFNFLF